MTIKTIDDAIHISENATNICFKDIFGKAILETEWTFNSEVDRIHSSELMKAVVEKSKNDNILQGACLYGHDLSGLDLSNADLRYANMRHTNCENTIFDGANLSNVSLCGANLKGASFKNTLLIGVDFRGTIFDLALHEPINNKEYKEYLVGLIENGYASSYEAVSNFIAFMDKNGAFGAVCDQSYWRFNEMRCTRFDILIPNFQSPKKPIK